MHDNVVKLKPPMCFSEADAERVVRELGEVLHEIAAEAAAKASSASS
jgi:4-aminobutyrate aminotransferase-like enzyme